MADPVKLKYVASTAVFQKDIFKGKVAFVTGGGSGICAFWFPLALRFAC